MTGPRQRDRPQRPVCEVSFSERAHSCDRASRYSTDIAPSDFHFFPKVNSAFKGKSKSQNDSFVEKDD